MVAQVGSVQGIQTRTSTSGTGNSAYDVTGGMLSSATGAASGANYSQLFLNRRSLETLGLPLVGQSLDDTQAKEVQVEVSSVIGDSIKEKLRRIALSDRSSLGKVLSFISVVESKQEIYIADLKAFEDALAVQSSFTAGTVTASSSSSDIDSLATATSAIITTRAADLATAQTVVDAAQLDVDAASSNLATLQLGVDSAQAAVADYTNTHFDAARATAWTNSIATRQTAEANLQNDVTNEQNALAAIDPADTDAQAAAQARLTAAQTALASEQSLLADDQAALVVENAKPAVIQRDLDALNATLATSTGLRDTAATDLAAKETILTAAETSRNDVQAAITTLYSEKSTLDSLKANVLATENSLDDYVLALTNLEIELNQTRSKSDNLDSGKAKGVDSEDADGTETIREEIVRPSIANELKQMSRRYEDSRLLDLADRVSRGEKLTDIISDKRKLTASLERIRDRQMREQEIDPATLPSAGTLGRNRSISLETLPDAPRLGRTATTTPSQSPPKKEQQPTPENPEIQPERTTAAHPLDTPPITARPNPDDTVSNNRSTLTKPDATATQTIPPNGIPDVAIAADAIAALNPRSFQMQDFLGAMAGLKNRVTNRELLVPLSRLDETAQRKIAQQFISFSKNLKAAVDASNEIFDLLKKRENPNPAGRIRVEM